MILRIPATFLRGGTSKGIFINKADLPSDRAQWDRIFLGIMGSPDPDHKRQLNGMGGGVSSLSKICVVAPSTSPPEDGIDVEYTFAQVGIADDIIDYSGNCGNLSSMVGVFALDEGLCLPRRATSKHATIRAFNTNTSKLIDATFPISRVKGSSVITPMIGLKEISIAGVPGMASEISLEFLSPIGARTGKLLPTGNLTDVITVNESINFTVLASLVDATNPTVFLSTSCARPYPPTTLSSAHSLFTLERIRQQAARLMDLDPNAQAQPKIAILSPPSLSEKQESGIDIRVHALSMGVIHRAVPMTVGLCLGVAAGIKGTLAWEIVHGGGPLNWRTRALGGGTRTVRIAHPSGVVDVSSEVQDNGEVVSVKVARTGKRLMKGHVWW